MEENYKHERQVNRDFENPLVCTMMSVVLFWYAFMSQIKIGQTRSKLMMYTVLFCISEQKLCPVPCSALN